MIFGFICRSRIGKQVLETESMAQETSRTKFASNDKSSNHGHVDTSLRGQEAESVVRQSRTILASPPAATGSLQRGNKNGGALAGRSMAIVGLGLLGLTACTAPPAEIMSSHQAQAEASEAEQQRALSPTASASDQPAGTTEKPAKPTPAPKDAAEQLEPSQVPTEEPEFEPSKPYQHTAVAFEADDDGLPAIKREGKDVPEDQQVTISKKPSKGTGSYADGIEVSVALTSQGKVKSEGPGYFTGAPYAVFAVTVQNDDDQDLDLSQVLITAVTDGNDIAQPLYGEVKTYDFSGMLSAGESQKTDYAFMVSDQTKNLTLHVDLDAVHEPMDFKQKLAKK